MSKHIETAPERIYLQISDTDADAAFPFPETTEGVTWCAESVVTVEVQYIRADMAEQQRDKLLAALELIMERMDLPPDTDCYCHISPPCHDCVENSGIREAIELAESTLAEVKGESK